jgi:hypothetical protein
VHRLGEIAITRHARHRDLLRAARSNLWLEREPSMSPLALAVTSKIELAKSEDRCSADSALC